MPFFSKQFKRFEHFYNTFIDDTLAQSTLEYALVLSSCLAIIVSLGVIWHVIRDGAVTNLAVGAASHTMGSSLLEFTKDVLSF